MDLLKIAARVAQGQTGVPEAGGDGMRDWTFEMVQDEDAEGSAPTFLAKGTMGGQPFECKIGVELDDAANARSLQRIDAKGSRVAVLVIPTDEERMIAKHSISLIARGAS